MSSGDDFRCGIKEIIESRKGESSRSKEGPVSDSLRIAAMPFEGQFSPGGFPLTNILE